MNTLKKLIKEEITCCLFELKQTCFSSEKTKLRGWIEALRWAQKQIKMLVQIEKQKNKRGK